MDVARLAFARLDQAATLVDVPLRQIGSLDLSQCPTHPQPPMTTLYLPREHFVLSSSRLRMICDIAIGLTTEHANEIGDFNTHQLENDIPARGRRTRL